MIGPGAFLTSETIRSIISIRIKIWDVPQVRQFLRAGTDEFRNWILYSLPIERD